MSFSENKKIILKSREAFLKLQIVDKTIQKFDFKTLFNKKSQNTKITFWCNKQFFIEFTL
jgi:hypothetical protein